MSTAQEIITRAREEWLQDENAVEWSDTRLLRHLNDAHRFIARTMARVRNARWFTHEESFSVANAARAFDLNGLSKSFLAVRTLYHLPSTGVPVKMESVGDGEENYGEPVANALVSPEVTPTYHILQTDAATRDLVILPPASGTRNFRLLYVYQPVLLTLPDTVLTLDTYDDLLAAELARRAFISEGEIDDMLVGFTTQRMTDLVEDLASSDGETSARRIRDAGGVYSGFGGGY